MAKPIVEMTLSEYTLFYASLFVALAIAAHFINDKWPGAIPENFVLFHGVAAFVFMFYGLYNGVTSFIFWVMHFWR